MDLKNISLSNINKAHLIGIGLMAFILVMLKKKNTEQPDLKFICLSYKVISILIYVGIAINLILIIAILTGLISS